MSTENLVLTISHISRLKGISRQWRLPAQILQRAAVSDLPLHATSQLSDSTDDGPDGRQVHTHTNNKYTQKFDEHTHVCFETFLCREAALLLNGCTNFC